MLTIRDRRYKTVKDCIFCQIIKGKIPADFVYQDDDLVAFQDINPIAPVHVLIVPREHIEGVQKVQKKDLKILGKMLLTASKIAKQKKLKGYKLFFNCGKLGGQLVYHLHLHLIGGWKTLEEHHRWVKKRVQEGGVL